MSKINLRKISPTKRYTIAELAKKIDYSTRAIYDMIKNGLPFFTGENTYKISGEEFINFVKQRREKRKIGTIRQDEMLCLKCKTPKKPLKKRVQINDYSHQIETNANKGAIDLIGICPVCGSKMHRFDYKKNLEMIQGIFNIVDEI